MGEFRLSLKQTDRGKNCESPSLNPLTKYFLGSNMFNL